MPSLLDDDQQFQPPGSTPSDLLGLLRIAQPDPNQPDVGTGFGQLYQTASDYLAAQRAKSAQMGLWDDASGGPTSKGLLDAASQYGNALLAGTIAPRLSAGRALEFKLNPDAPGFADRISTRTPSIVQAPDLHASPDYLVGADSFNASQGGAKVPYQQRTADIIAQQPGFERFANGNYSDPSEVHEAYVSHMVDNLKALHGEVAKTDWGPDSANWYDGANTVASNGAAKYGLLPRQGAGMIARLSPGTPWDMNVEQFNRTADIAANQGNTPMTDAMRQLYAEKYAPQTLPNGKPNPDYKPTWAVGMQAIDDGRILNDMHGPDAGLFVRLYDEAHNPDYATYRQVNPDGTYGQVMPDRYTPNSNSNIGGAISILRNGSLENISETLGNGHKIRNFHNNIVSPDAGGDVTIDTHAMAAAHLMPWGASRPEVAYGFGNSPQGYPGFLTGAKGGAATGSDGLYPLYAEAYRRAAGDLGLLPRQLQSMTWEGIKGLYEPAARRGRLGDQLLGQNSDLWRAYENGQSSLADTQSSILGRGIKRPGWSGGGASAGGASQ